MKHPIKIIQLAYGEMAPFALKSLLQQFIVTAIITPSPQIGLYRSAKVLPVETLARKFKIPIIRNDTFSALEKAIHRYHPAAVIIASYNKVIPDSILKLSKFINLHHGDLPRWRGRANVNWAIILGKPYIGLTIHEAIPDLDAGAIYAQFKIPITSQDTVKSVYVKINHQITSRLAHVVTRVLSGYKGKPQQGKSTYCITRLPEDGLIDWTKTTLEIDRLIRALTRPYPGAFTYLDGRKLIIWAAQIPKSPRRYVGRIPGRVSLIYQGKGVEVLTGDSSIILTDVTYGRRHGNASNFIKTVKTSLGINWVKLYENLLR